MVRACLPDNARHTDTKSLHRGLSHLKQGQLGLKFRSQHRRFSPNDSVFQKDQR